MVVVGLLLLMGASLALRSGGLGGRLWMDEGIAVGIASHPLSEIPELLRQDGSPPLYYLLLHGWMAVAGRSEAAVHWLSLLFAVLCVPAAWWAGSAAGGRRVGWVLAVLVACSPFLTGYASEARMYSLVVLVGLLCVGCFAKAFVAGRRAWRVPFGVALALSLYAHNWALFGAAGLAVAFAVVARAARRPGMVRDGAIGFGVAALLYAPWVPTLVFQARHTGAPWATAPGLGSLLHAPALVLGGVPAAIALAVGAAVGLARGSRRALAGALLAAAVIPVALGWLLSQAAPAWDGRYLAVVLAPALLLAALGLTRARALGVVALALVVALWAPARVTPGESNAFQLTRAAERHLRAGDLVLAGPFGQVPLLAYYLPPGLRYATALGPDRDPHVVDWRDAAARFARTSATSELRPLLDRARVGTHVLLVLPHWDRRSAQTALGRQERRRSAQDERALFADHRFSLAATLPGRPLRALLFRKVST